MITREELQKFDQLPTLPSVAARILELVFDDAPNTEEIITLVESDQALSSKILRIVNSASYGQSREIVSVKHAISLIGFDSLKHLVLSVTIYDEFMQGETKKYSLDKSKFWQHSFSVALIARELAKQTGFKASDLAYTTALLHDIGKVAIDRFNPEAFKKIAFLFAHSPEKSLLNIEKEVIGESHDTIGGWLGEIWKLPEQLTLTIQSHHYGKRDIFSDERINQHLVEIITYADRFSWAQGLGSQEALYSPLVEDEKLKFIKKGQLATADIYKSVDVELKNFASIFNFPLPDSYKFREALMKANIELGKLNSLYFITQKKLERQVTELSMLNKAVRIARMSLKLEEIIKTLLNAIKDGLGFDRAFFFFYDKESSKAMGHSCVGNEEGDENQVQSLVIPILPQNKSFFECVNQTMKPFIINLHKASDIEKRIFKNWKSPEIGVLPIISKNAVIAFFLFDNPVSQNPLANYSMETLTIIGNEAGLGIENFKLFEELKRMAIMDELTQVYNRRQCLTILYHEFNRSRRYGHPFSLLMLDIDFFKKFNDKYGHDVGDKVLKVVSGIAQKEIRQSDVFGRFGGEEFLVILPETDMAGAMVCAEKLRKAIEERGTDEMEKKAEEKITVSVGVAQMNKDHKSPEDVIKEADLALYQAKKNGRNRSESFTKP